MVPAGDTRFEVISLSELFVVREAQWQGAPWWS